MPTRSLAFSAFALIPLAAALPGNAAVVYNEFSQPDLSDDRFAPTPLALQPGSNTLFGILEGMDANGDVDLDYFTITIPNGHVLSRIDLVDYISTDFAAFIAVQPGSVFPNDPITVLAEDLYGWALFGPSDVGTDLLDKMGNNGQGFTPPLPAGTYTFWAQQRGAFTEWNADFVVEVPGPGVIGLLGAGSMIALRRRRRRDG